MTIKTFVTWLTAVTVVTGAIWGVAAFWFPHIGQTQSNTIAAEEAKARAMENAAVVEELQKIRREEFAREQAKQEMLRGLCRLKDESAASKRECVMSGHSWGAE